MKILYCIGFLIFFSACLHAQTDTNAVQVDSAHLPPEPVFIKPKPKPVVVAQKEIPSIFTDSIFYTNGAEKVQYNIQSYQKPQRNYLLPVVMLIMLSYLTWIRYQYAKEISENITVITNANLGQQIYRDREYSLNIFTMLTFINFSVATGVFLYIAAVKFAIPLPFGKELFDIIFCIAVVVAGYLGKTILYRIAGYLYHIGDTVSMFRFNTLVIYQLAGFALLPFLIFAATSPEPVAGWAVIGGFILFGIILLVRLFKGLQIAGQFITFRFVYFFLYLCAFEIAPVIIVYKVFTTQF